MNPSTGTPDRWTALSRFMVDAGQVPDSMHLATHGLQAVAYARVPNTHAEHGRWREAYLRRIATHLATRATLVPLIRTWRDHGIEVLLFKGFYLADFVYQNPAERYYRDVDVLVPEADSARASSLASGCGWAVKASRSGATSGNVHSHMETILRRGNVLIDLHRFVVQNVSADERLASHYTAAAWAASREVPWEGTTVRVLDARDSALLGLVTGRAWSHDTWRLKMSDYRDLEVLAEHEGLTRDALAARATELGCPLTLQLVLDRCDPWRRHLDMTPPTGTQVRRWEQAVAHEHGPRSPWRRLRPVGASIGGLLAALPGLLRARRLVWRHRDAAALLDHVRSAPAVGAALTPAGRRRVFGGTRLGAVLVQPSGDRCLVRSVALFERLRAHGEPVRLRLGTDAEGRLHGWIRYEADNAAPVETWQHCPVREVSASLPPEPSAPPVGRAGGHDLLEAVVVRERDEVDARRVARDVDAVGRVEVADQASG